MSDIVTRLREVAEIETGLLYSRRHMLKDAADEITALRSERDALKALCDEMAKALERPAKLSQNYSGFGPSDAVFSKGCVYVHELRDAASALAAYRKATEART